MNKLVHLLVLFALHFFTQTLSFQQHDVHFNNKIRMHIVDDVPNVPSPTLTVHCKSKDDDLGQQNLANGKEFYFEFRENFATSTLFFCQFNWAARQATFNVWPVSDPNTNCRVEEYEDANFKCFWKVSVDGFYLGNGEGNYTKLQDWS